METPPSSRTPDASPPFAEDATRGDAESAIAGDMTTLLLLSLLLLADTKDDDSKDVGPAAVAVLAVMALRSAWAAAARSRRALAGACSMSVPRMWAQNSGQSAPVPDGWGERGGGVWCREKA